jgi:hypothetical protein
MNGKIRDLLKKMFFPMIDLDSCIAVIYSLTIAFSEPFLVSRAYFPHDCHHNINCCKKLETKLFLTFGSTFLWPVGKSYDSLVSFSLRFRCQPPLNLRSSNYTCGITNRTRLLPLCGLGNRGYPDVFGNSINLVSFQNRSGLGSQTNDRAI